MLPPLGPTLKEKDATKWLASLSGYLAPGESVRALSRFSTMRPLTDAIAVTDRRVIAFFSASVSKKGPLVEISSADIGQADAHTKFGGRTLTVHAPGQQSRHIGTMRADDVSFVVGQVNAIAAAREPEAPTVDVYDPFSKPWEAPSAPAEVSRPQSEAPVAQNFPPPNPSIDESVWSQPDHGGGVKANTEPRRLVPRWKTVPAWALAVFCSLGVVASAFAPEIRGSGTALYLALLLVPLLMLSRFRRNSLRKRAAVVGVEPSYGFAERNWLPVGIPLIVLLFVLFGVLS